MRILHCSDVHITQDYVAAPWTKLGWRRVVGLGELILGRRQWQYTDAPRVLRRIVEDVDRAGASHLIVSGDLTTTATEEEFRTARECLESIADPRRCTVVPGNHDAYTRHAVSMRRFEKYFAPLIVSDWPEYCREDRYPFIRLLGEEAAIVGLCSARLPPVPGIAYGTLGEAQLSGLRDILRDPRLGRRAVLVVVHHAPLDSDGRPDRLHHRLGDVDKLLDLLPGPRFAVLHGHIHRRYHHEATATRPHLFGAGSSTQRGHEGYWLIDVQDGRIAGGERRTL